MTSQHHEYSKWCDWWRKLAVFACCLCFSTTMAAVTVAAFASVNLASAASVPVPMPMPVAPASESTVPAGAAAAAAATTATTGAAYRKRVVLRSIDPLTRRSAVDKHFIRFGRNEQQTGADKSINLRKREILHGDDGAADAFATANNADVHAGDGGGNGHGHRTIADLTSSLLTCSSSASNSSHRACFGRLRVRRLRPHLPQQQQQQQQHHHHRRRFRHDVTTNNDANLDSNDLLANADIAVAVVDSDSDDVDNDQDGSDDDSEDKYNATGATNTLVEEKSGGGGGGDDDDDDDENDEQEQRPRPRPKLRPPTVSKTSHVVFVRPNDAASATESDSRNPALRMALGDDPFVRTSRNTFSRNLFSRYDRGRDNFMRLGRSKTTMSGNADVTKENPTPLMDETEDGGGGGGSYYDDNDGGGGGGGDDDYVVGRDRDEHAVWSRTKRAVSAQTGGAARFPRKHDNFMRLGRKHDSRFLRLGRMNTRSSSFIRYGRNGPAAGVGGSGSGGGGGGGGGDYDSWTRKHDNFMRLGRNEQRLLQQPQQHQRRQTKREKPENFMRLGRAENFIRLGRSRLRPRPHPDDDGDNDNVFTPPRSVRKSSNFMRLGRPDPDYDDIFTPPRPVRKSDNFVRFGRGSAALDGQSVWNFGLLDDDDNDDDPPTWRRFTRQTSASTPRHHHQHNRDDHHHGQRGGGGGGGRRRRRQADTDSQLWNENRNANGTQQLDHPSGDLLESKPLDEYDYAVFALPNVLPQASPSPAPPPALRPAFSSKSEQLVASHVGWISVPQKPPAPSPSPSPLRQQSTSTSSVYAS